MNLPKVASQLTKLYNTLGNKWLTDNFHIKPFDFRVYLRKADLTEPYDYIAEVYSDRPIPQFFQYKEGMSDMSVETFFSLRNHLKSLATYVDDFGSYDKFLGLKLMDVQQSKSDKTIKERKEPKKIPISKLVDQYIKPIYPMVDKIELLEIGDVGVIKIMINDDEINSDNMYSKGLDSHYLIDFHLKQYLPYLGIDKKTIIWVAINPNGEVIAKGLG